MSVYPKQEHLHVCTTKHIYEMLSLKYSIICNYICDLDVSIRQFNVFNSFFFTKFLLNNQRKYSFQSKNRNSHIPPEICHEQEKKIADRKERSSSRSSSSWNVSKHSLWQNDFYSHSNASFLCLCVWILFIFMGTSPRNFNLMLLLLLLFRWSEFPAGSLSLFVQFPIYKTMVFRVVRFCNAARMQTNCFRRAQNRYFMLKH